MAREDSGTDVSHFNFFTLVLTNPLGWLYSCDAEPEALATYILALLKHDASEHDLHEELVKQLDEFFEDGA